MAWQRALALTVALLLLGLAPAAALPRLDVAALFGEFHTVSKAAQLVRSINLHTTGYERHYHIIAPVAVHTQIEAGFPSPAPDGSESTHFLHMYAFEQCEALVPLALRALSNPALHFSIHCNRYLVDILPRSVKRVLFIDNDVTAVQSIAPCWNTRLEGDQFIGMVVDAGDICQRYPDTCWPMAYQWNVAKGLVCGNVPSLGSPNATPCVQPGEPETVQMNGGVMLMDLEKMRAAKFTERYLEVFVRTARMTDFKPPRWGQDILNTYFRHYPGALALLPCGCNYQYTGVRRMVKCPNQQVYLAHGWHKGIQGRTNNPYNQLFYHMLSGQEGKLPAVPTISESDPALPDLNTEPAIYHVEDCPLQSYNCKDKDEFWQGQVYLNETVYILTRTAGNGDSFKHHAQSILSQSHPHLVHLVVTDDPRSSWTYLDSYPHQLLPKVKMTPGSAPAGSCEPTAAAGGAGSAIACKCDPLHPTNAFLASLHKGVNSGWVIYMEDTTVLTRPHAVMELLARSLAKDVMLVWNSSKYHGVDPKHIGDSIAPSNFMFHSSRLRKDWGNDECAGHLTARALTQVMRTIVVPNVFTSSIYEQSTNLQTTKVTIVATSYDVTGLRKAWLQDNMRKYSSPEFSDLVAKIILVWNNPDVPAPSMPANVLVINVTTNSLNNRWTLTLPHIETEAVLNFDDDMSIERYGMECLIANWLEDKSRLVGPFPRATKGYEYVMKDYWRMDTPMEPTIILPRIMMVHRKYLVAYSAGYSTKLREYVDSQGAHCDDIALNVLAASISQKPVLGAVLPIGSVTDHYSLCYKVNRGGTGGLALQDNREALRHECLRHIMDMYGGPGVLKAAKDVGTCEISGVMRREVAKVSRHKWWRAMRQAECLQEESRRRPTATAKR